MPMVITVWGATALISGFLGFLLASAKRRSADFWTAISFLFPPSLIAVLMLPRASEAMVADRQMRKMLRRLTSDD